MGRFFSSSESTINSADSPTPVSLCTFKDIASTQVHLSKRDGSMDVVGINGITQIQPKRKTIIMSIMSQLLLKENRVACCVVYER